MARVSAALVIAKRDDGSDVYLYEGAELPEGLKDGEDARLQEGGFLSSSDEDEKPAAKKAAASKSDK